MGCSGAESQEGVRRTLLRRTRFGALALRGCVLPDATLRGEAEFRPHDGAVPIVSNGISSEVSSPGSVLSVESGAPDLVLTRLQVSRVGTVPRGRRQLVADRWPRVTGLASYLSGCFRGVCSRTVRFVASFEEEFLRALPVRSLHAASFRFSRR